MKMKAHRTKPEPDKVWLGAGKLLHFVLSWQPKPSFLNILSWQHLKAKRSYNGKWWLHFFQARTVIASNQHIDLHWPSNAGFQLWLLEMKGEHKHPMTCLYSHLFG